MDPALTLRFHVSGAEGTVIEEQDNLPRIIWGLEGDDASSNRPPCDVVATLPTHSTPQKHHRVQQQPNGQVPPRFQSQPEAAQPSRDTSRKQNVQLPRTQPSRIPSPAPSLLSEHADLQRSLPGHGPIDLSNILRPRESTSNFSTRELYDALPQDSYSYGVNHGVSADWQSLILAQDKVQDHPMPSSVSVLADEIGNYLRPSFSTSTVSSLASSRSPIVIEPPGLPPSHQMIRQEAPRRTTALEIAQKYRQDQLQQYQQPALPTPPDSSSPIWNSRFSPHQHSFVSPDLLQRSTFPQGASGFTSTVSRSLRPRAGQGALDTHPFNTAATGIFSLERQTPHVTPQGSFLGTQDPPALDRTTVNSMLHLLQLRGSNSQVQGCPNTHVHSPARAKHSTSSAPAGTGLNRQALPQRSSSSPSSPITGTRAAHHQQPRTVSLNAVVQRRLSSVPEEDPTSLRGHTPSPAVSPTKYGPGNYPTGDLSTSSAIDVPPRPQQEDIIPPSPLVETGNRGNPLRGVMDLNGRRNFFPATQTEPYVGIPVGRGRSSTPGPAKGKGDPRQQDDPARAPRGRGKGRGLGKPRRGRGGPSGRGPERVDGGITVRS